MITLISLISNAETPLLIRYDALQGVKETKSQYAGLIFSSHPDDNGYRRTRVNKPKINKVRIAQNKLYDIEMEIWCMNEDVDSALTLLLAEFDATIKGQEETIEKWKEITISRKAKLHEIQS